MDFSLRPQYVDGCIPSDLATGSTSEIEEERRLLYVAMTRARDQLHLMLPQRFFTHGQRSLGDRHVYAQRTRFIPDALTRHFESRTWQPSIARERRPPRRANLWTCERTCGECGRKYLPKAMGFIEARGNVDRVAGILLTPPALTQCHAGTIASGRPALPRMVPRPL